MPAGELPIIRSATRSMQNPEVQVSNFYNEAKRGTHTRAAAAIVHPRGHAQVCRRICTTSGTYNPRPSSPTRTPAARTRRDSLPPLPPAPRLQIRAQRMKHQLVPSISAEYTPIFKW